MKYQAAYLILIISLVSVNFLFGQIDTSNVIAKTDSSEVIAQTDSTRISANEMINIREFVAKQIREIQAAEAEKATAQLQNDSKLIKASVFKEKEASITIFDKALLFIKENIFSKLFISIEILFLLLIIFFWYKSKPKTVRIKKSVLKENIRKLREEKIDAVLNSRLSKIRSRLVLQPIKIDGRNITAMAKRLSISKGEIHLAAKINLMMKQA